VKQEVCSRLRVVVILRDSLTTIDVTKCVSVVFKKVIEDVIHHQSKCDFFEKHIAQGVIHTKICHKIGIDLTVSI
jgi:hypothetical protein